MIFFMGAGDWKKLPKRNAPTFSSWLDQHLEEFVRPQLGLIPNVNPKDYRITDFTTRRAIVLRALWNEVKRKAEAMGRPVLLPGRDTWLFEMLARIDGFPTIFRPDISGAVARASVVTEDYSKAYCVDTGYKGTVPKALGCEEWNMIYYCPVPPANAKNSATWKPPAEDIAKHQIFPLKTRGRYENQYYSLAGYMECIEKYWTTGKVVDGKITQQLVDDRAAIAGVGHFQRAAQITINVAQKTPVSLSRSMKGAA